MSKKFYGSDIHKNYSTISVLNINGEEIEFINRCTDLKSFMKNRMSEHDSVVIESATSSFNYSDLIEAQGVSCIIFNPYKFKIIRDSWEKQINTMPVTWQKLCGYFAPLNNLACPLFISQIELLEN